MQSKRILKNIDLSRVGDTVVEITKHFRRIQDKINVMQIKKQQIWEVTDDFIKKNRLLDWGMEKLDTLSSGLSEAAAKVGEVVKPAVDKAKSAATSAASKAKDGIVDTEVLSETPIKEAAAKMASKTGEAAGKAGEKIAAAAGKAKEKVAEVAAKAKEKVAEAAKK